MSDLLEKAQRIHIKNDVYVFGGWGLFEDFADVFWEGAGGGGFQHELVTELAVGFGEWAGEWLA